MSLNFDIWNSVLDGYVALTSSTIDQVGKRFSENNTKAMNAILCDLP